jgi:cell division protein FtsI/penicillin-binding protein 2
MVGLAAITSHVIKPLEGIECTGYLVLPVLGPDHQPIPGARIREPRGRCWVLSEWKDKLQDLIDETKGTDHPITNLSHHPIPVFHRGHDGNLDGFLTYSDALERSCNVYFETVADRLTWADESGLWCWYDRFGFGRPTHVGIEEADGRVPGKPGSHPPPAREARMDRCLAGIGEGQVEATPLQIANEAATIARGGIWMRPHLLSAETQKALDDARGGPDPNAGPDAVDLNLDPAALEQAKIGMINVVYARSGTGTIIRRTDMIVAGKTGTADGARIFLPVIGQDGKPVLDKDGKKIMAPMAPAYRGSPPSDHDWYRTGEKGQTSVTHSWFMGYAPADHPQIAFCVLVEYAGEGGGNGIAGSIAKQVLEACVQHGYLHPTGPTTPVADLDN